MIISSAALAYSFSGSARRFHLPGPTTDGHYQIELECGACHTQAFSDREALQQACEKCHGAELREAHDSHPQKKFTDPRNADRTALLDARYCVTCHREHRPELVSEMGLSLPRDYCYRCHESIAEERPSHRGLGFETCADGGCHNFHDNRALYEDFLGERLEQPKLLVAAHMPARGAAPRTAAPLALSEADAPAGVVLAPAELAAWHASSHAAGRVNCSGCHVPDPKSGRFEQRVGDATCAGCHEREHEGFKQSRHGMRGALGFPKLRVADARRPMRADAAAREVSCTSCHASHAFDTRAAAMDACLGCHDDGHSRNHRASKHAELWLADPSGRSGASCATCHLPRTVSGDTTSVVHNQNDNLRPNEKMVRGVCMNCHGLGYSLDALADAALVQKNFKGEPATHVPSLDMVRARGARH